ncbi:MAG: cytochrome P450 [Actinobacteria bacterium]|nr:MAG: cytochrome P450 [Actinomycetota bacterium]
MDLEEAAPVDVGLLIFTGGAADDPHAAYRQVRETCPVARAGEGEWSSVYISRYEDVLWALRHPEVFSSSDAFSIGQEQPLIPLQMDPPEHTWYRRLLNPEFVPRKVGELEPDVRRDVNALIDKFASRGDCDFHQEFATPLPSAIFLRLFGLPMEDLPTFLRWRDELIRPNVEPGDLEAAAAIREATSKAINEYFVDAVADHRRTRGDGLLGQLVHTNLDGRALTDRELLGICQLMLLGGLDTVTATLDCMVAYLARHPDRRRQLVADPGLIAAAVEELLRHQTPVTVVPRALRQDVTMSGVELRAGERVTLVLGAANADGEEFGGPEDVALSRDPNRHLAFGGGHHLCLGAHLARLELGVALEELHRRIPDYALAEGAEIHFSAGIRQADHLPLVFPPALPA